MSKLEKWFFPHQARIAKSLDMREMTKVPFLVEDAWNAAIESMQEEIDKRDVRIKELEGALSMFTDQKSSSFPNGEMISMHGGNGNGQYICEYNYETIEKARMVLGKIKGTKRTSTPKREKGI